MKFKAFFFKKVPILASFRVKLVNFQSEKCRFSLLLRSLHFGSNRLILHLQLQLYLLYQKKIFEPLIEITVHFR